MRGFPDRGCNGTLPSISITWHIRQKFFHPHSFRRSHNPPHRPHGNLVRTGYQGGRRCRAGRVAETRLEIFIRGPGPSSRLPHTGRGHRGGPDERARTPAGRWEGAINLLYEVLTQRPASRLLPRGRSLTIARPETGRGIGEACAQIHRDHGAESRRRGGQVGDEGTNISPSCLHVSFRQKRPDPLDRPQDILLRIGVGKADIAFAENAEIRSADQGDASLLEQRRSQASSPSSRCSATFGNA